MEDLNSDSDSDENETASQAPGEEAGEVHDEDEREFQQTRAEAQHLELQQRVPSLGAPVGGNERALIQNIATFLCRCV